MNEVLQLPQMLSDSAKPYYVTQAQVESLVNYDSTRDAAMVMVSERHNKADLVDLVSAITRKYESRLAKLDMSEDEMRAEFEKWFFGEDSLVRLKRKGDSYEFMSAHSAWNTYCAAVNMVKERCK
ncbi:MAG: hypothetical protein ACRCWJ_14910 [Casimicrobium sp.]